jgi:MFS family permease
VPLTAAITLWFRRHLGVGMGILQASQGIGPLVAVPIILLIFNGFGGGASGLRAAFWIPGVGGGLILLLLARLFYNEPADINARPLGAAADEPVRSVSRGQAAQTRTRIFSRQVMRTPTFWNLISIHFWGCAGHAIILVFLVAIAEERGVSVALAAGTFMTLTVTSTLTRFAVPVLADNFGSRGIMAVCFFLQVAPVLLLFFAQDAWMFYLFAVLFGIGFGGEMTAFPIINRQYYGSAPIGTTYGYQMMGAGIGMAVGAWLGGLLRDVTDSFTATITMSLIFSALGVLSILFLPRTSQELLPGWEENLPEEYRSTPGPIHSHGD